MKKLMVVALAALVTAAASSPAGAFEGLRMGVRGGVHYSKVSGNYQVTEYQQTIIFEDWTNEPGTGLGLFFNLGINKYIAIQPEFLFAVKGTLGEIELNEDDIQSVEADIRLDYFEIPLLVKVTLPTGRFFNPFVTAGGYYGYNSKADRELDIVFTNGRAFDLIKRDMDHEIKKYDYGISFGGGIDFRIFANIDVYLEARYQMGMSNIAEREVDDLENRSLFFTGGFNWPLYTP